jgi:tetratricopeptide (TPR) repeat protein
MSSGHPRRAAACEQEVLMMGRILLLLTALLLSGISPLFSQSGDIAGDDLKGAILPAVASDEPSWLLMERGLREMDEGEYGRALYLFSRVLDLQTWNPEAEMAVGDIFLIEGETVLAEEQYKKAYALRESFIVPEDVYTVLYKLADLYKITARTEEWQETLTKVLAEDEKSYTDTFLRQKDTYLDKYLEQGPDKLLELYRLERLPEARAHWELAELYYRSGVFDRTALIHRLFGVVAIVSDAIVEYRHVDPLFQFTDLAEFLRLSADRDNIRSYYAATDLYEHLYFLGVSTFGFGNEARARQLWELLTDIPAAGRYQRLSERQLTSPWVDLPSL